VLQKGEVLSPPIYQVDVAGWLACGWGFPAEEKAESVVSESIPVPTVETQASTESDPATRLVFSEEARRAELEAMDWRQLKAEAEKIGILEKPEEGWEAVIPIIVELEADAAKQF
jgi:hypothetical protein